MNLPIESITNRHSRRPARSSLVAIGLLLLATSVAAQNVLVAPSGAFATIQAAIAAAQNGDVVEVPPGTYSESLDLLGKQIVLRSQAGRALTIMDSPTRLILAAGGETTATRIEGFTFRGVHGDDSAAVEVDHAGLSIVDCFFDGIEGLPSQYAGKGSSALRSIVGDLIVSGCRFEACRGSDGITVPNGFGLGGASGAALAAAQGHVEIRASQFVGNRAGSHGDTNVGSQVAWSEVAGDGGALALIHMDALIVDCDFVGNEAGGAALNQVTGGLPPESAGSGGAIYCAGETSTIVIEDSRFIGNSSGGNRFLPGGVLGDGGAIQATTAGLTVSRCVFVGNRAALGGGITMIDRTGSTLTGVRIENSLFIGNQAAREGGALSLRNLAGSQVVHCDFVANGAYLGAAIHGYGSTALPLTVVNSIFHDSWGPDVAPPGNQSPATRLFIGNLIGQAGLPGHSNIVGDPGFVDRAAWDFRLRPDSICVDAGQALTVALATDWDGQARVFGAGPDIGADEFVGLGLAATGNVPDGSGGVADILSLDGQAGGAQRLVELPIGAAPIWRLDPPPGANGPNHFILWGRVGLPSFAEATPIVFAGAELCFAPQPIDLLNPLKFTLADSFGGTPWAFLPQPGPAPFAVQLPPIGQPIEVTIQGLILDDQQQFRATNAVAVKVR